MWTALVLDDDAQLRKLIQDALLAEGWGVRTATRGEAALHLAAVDEPDMVLLDVSKPDFAPEAVAAGLRIHYGPELPILAMGTSPQPELVRRIGAYAFIQKPFELARLLALLERGATLAEQSRRLRMHSDEALSRMKHLRLLRPDGD